MTLEQRPDASQIRARRHPFVVLLVYAVHVAVALAIAWPVANIVADPALAHPRADAVLFEPGALYLTEALRLALHPLTSALRGSLFAIFLASYLGLLPLGGLLHALNSEGRVTLAELSLGAARLFSRFSLLLGISLAVLLFSSVFLTLFSAAMPSSIGGPYTRQADIAEGVVVLVGGGLFAFVGLVHDLARATTVRAGLGPTAAIAEGARVLRRRAPTAVLAWSWRAALGTALVVLGGMLSTAVSVESAGWAAVLIVHQAIAFALVALRASWLSCALRLVATTD
jgi:hypothetical protein